MAFVIHPPLMMVQSRAESIWEINNCGKYINQFPPNTIKSIRQYERINKKIYRQKISIVFNEICINEEMLPKHTHTHTHTYIYIYIYIYIYCARARVCVRQWSGRPEFNPSLSHTKET